MAARRSRSDAGRRGSMALSRRKLSRAAPSKLQGRDLRFEPGAVGELRRSAARRPCGPARQGTPTRAGARRHCAADRVALGASKRYSRMSEEICCSRPTPPTAPGPRGPCVGDVGVADVAEEQDHGAGAAGVPPEAMASIRVLERAQPVAERRRKAPGRDRRRRRRAREAILLEGRSLTCLPFQALRKRTHARRERLGSEVWRSRWSSRWGCHRTTAVGNLRVEPSESGSPAPSTRRRASRSPPGSVAPDGRARSFSGRTGDSRSARKGEVAHDRRRVGLLRRRATPVRAGTRRDPLLEEAAEVLREHE